MTPYVPVARDFPEKLVYLLKARDMSQAQLAAKTGLTQPRISKWLKPTGEPGPMDLWKIAQATECSLEFLCNPDCVDPALVPQSDDQTLQTVYVMIKRLGPSDSLDRLLRPVK
jgi:transcriptional regulator with XRE-family HTH domain